MVERMSEHYVILEWNDDMMVHDGTIPSKDGWVIKDHVLKSIQEITEGSQWTYKVCWFSDNQNTFIGKWKMLLIFSDRKCATLFKLTWGGL
jgi:hypothetical protein